MSHEAASSLCENGTDEIDFHETYIVPQAKYQNTFQNSRLFCNEKIHQAPHHHDSDLFPSSQHPAQGAQLPAPLSKQPQQSPKSSHNPAFGDVDNSTIEPVLAADEQPGSLQLDDRHRGRERTGAHLRGPQQPQHPQRTQQPQQPQHLDESSLPPPPPPPPVGDAAPLRRAMSAARRVRRPPSPPLPPPPPLAHRARVPLSFAH